jgi:hypothetical protein
MQVRSFLVKAWVFFAAGAAIIAAAAVLNAAMRRAWYGEAQMSVAGYKIAPPQTDSAAKTAREPYEWWAEQPEYLLLADNPAEEPYAPPPEVITREEAAQRAATCLMQFFEADLRGLICSADYLPADGYAEDGAWIWQVTFGSDIDRTWDWTAILRADDGAFILLERRMVHMTEDGRRLYMTETDALDAEAYEAYKADCLRQAVFLTEKFVNADIRDAVMIPYETGRDTRLDSGNMPILIDVNYGGGGLLSFAFSTADGGPVRISRKEPTPLPVPMSEPTPLPAAEAGGAGVAVEARPLTPASAE